MSAFPESNRYPGQCHQCSSKVPAGEGSIYERPLRLLCASCGYRDRPCEECKKESRVEGQRFCSDCKKALLARMREEGYLEADWRGRAYRGRDARQAEDKDPNPWLENAVRALEDQ